MKLKILPRGQLQGRLTVPGDKSISHRASLLAAIAEGTSSLENFLMGEDNLATLHALQQLGVTFTQHTQTHIEIQGVGKKGLQAPSPPLDLGNSGTGMRLLAGLLAGQSFSSVLIGDSSLSQRPMNRILDPLKKMGACITAREKNFAPLHIQGRENLHGIHYTLPLPSAQVKSCLLLAGLFAEGITCIEESVPTRDHTERLLQHLNYPCEIISYDHKKIIQLNGLSKIKGNSFLIPGDFSSAAFFIVGALIAPHSELIIEKVGLNPTRTGLLTLLKKMGGEIEILDQKIEGNEPVGTLRIRASELQGITVPPELVSLCIDEFPIFFIAAACAKGETIVKNLNELRVKESDRLQGMAVGLKSLGISCELVSEGIQIQGGIIQGGLIDSYHDHRIAMAFSIAALRSNTPIYIENASKIVTSFPHFISLLASLKI